VSKSPNPTDLPEDVVQAAQAQLAAHPERFPSVADVLREGVEAVELREQEQAQYAAKLEALRVAIERGKRSGIAQGYSIERVLVRNGLDKVPG
jgi:Arc/MetJ-type ribon-helix-helix transcriptional regulator